jgi:hypothetical protein
MLSTDRDVSLVCLADALERVLVTSAEEARSIVHTLPPNLHPDARDVLANVMHFVDDADIRASDNDYKAMQETQMRQLIVALRSGAGRDELLRYSFLSSGD